MKICRLLLPLLLPIILFSCQPTKSGTDLIEISENQKNKSNTIFLDSIMEIEKYLMLKTPEGLVIGEVNKIVLSRDLIFICDQKLMNTVFVFDFQGNYKYHLTGGGKGPGEFIRIQSVACDYNSNECFILDDKSGQVLVYDEKGKWVKSMKTKFTSYDFFPVSKNQFAFCSGLPALETNTNGYDLVYTDQSGRVTDLFLKIEPWRLSATMIKDINFTSANKEIFYSPVYNDTIYNIGESSITPKYRINLGNQFINKSNRAEIDVSDPLNGYIHTINTFLIAGNTAYYNYQVVDPETRFFVLRQVFYNLENKRSVSGHSIGRLTTTGMYAMPLYSNSSGFIGALQPYLILEHYAGYKKQGRIMAPNFIKLAESLNKNDNPVLMFYSIHIK